MGRHVDQLQERLGRRVLVENPSSYLRFRHSTIAEPEFLRELVRRTGCGLLCDVNNVYVSGHNLGFDPAAYLDALPAGAVGEIHLAGHAVNDADGRTVLIDDHGSRADRGGLVTLPPRAGPLRARARPWWSGTRTCRRWPCSSPRPRGPTRAWRPPTVERAAGGTIRMLALRELQAAFRRAVQGEPEPALLAEIAEDGLTAGARLAHLPAPRPHHADRRLDVDLSRRLPPRGPRGSSRTPRTGTSASTCPASPCLFEYGGVVGRVPGRVPAVPRPRLLARRRPPGVGAARRAPRGRRRRRSTRRGSPPCRPTRRPGSCCAWIPSRGLRRLPVAHRRDLARQPAGARRPRRRSISPREGRGSRSDATPTTSCSARSTRPPLPSAAPSPTDSRWPRPPSRALALQADFPLAEAAAGPARGRDRGGPRAPCRRPEEV